MGIAGETVNAEQCHVKYTTFYCNISQQHSLCRVHIKGENVQLNL